MLRFLLVCVLAVGLGAAALAQSPTPSPGVPPGAVLLSVGATAIPVAVGALMLAGDGEPSVQAAGFGLIVLGSTLGPSVGSLYLGDTPRAGIGAGVRAAGWGLMAGGVVVSFWQEGPRARTGETMAYAGAAVLALGAAYSFATLPASARRGHDVRFGMTAGPDGEGIVPALVVRF